MALKVVWAATQAYNGRSAVGVYHPYWEEPGDRVVKRILEHDKIVGKCSVEGCGGMIIHGRRRKKRGLEAEEPQEKVKCRAEKANHA